MDPWGEDKKSLGAVMTLNSDEMVEMVRSSGDSLLPTWSGAPENQIEHLSWWFESDDDKQEEWP